jgi:hypothetical protein
MTDITVLIQGLSNDELQYLIGIGRELRTDLAALEPSPEVARLLVRAGIKMVLRQHLNSVKK